MEKVRKRARKDGKLGDRDKKKGWFSRWRYGRSRCAGFAEIYKEQKQLREALENELNKQGLGGSGQNALEKMKEIEKQILNKGFKNETLQKNLECKARIIEIKLSCSATGGEKKRQSESNKESLIMILNRCQTHC
jgi:hypothetical protein